MIRTPENVTFEFELAGIASRALAWIIDVAVMATLLIVASQVVRAVSPVLGGFGAALFLLAAFLIQWWYSAVLEWWWGGQTVGKRIVGLRSLSSNGIRMSFMQATVRNLMRIVDLLPGLYLVGGCSVLVDEHRRRLGDLAAGTIVVRERKAVAPTTVVPVSERYNTFVDDPAIAMAVRKITAPEREAMIGLSLRRERLPLPVRRELFAKLAAHLESHLGIARPHFFSEEKYVLNLTAVAMATQGRPLSQPDGSLVT